MASRICQSSKIKTLLHRASLGKFRSKADSDLT